MNEKETGELRRRLRTDKCAVSFIYGCFVNEKKEIVTAFRNSTATTDKDDTDALYKIMRKALSGTIGKNLIELPFSTAQVMDSDEHRLLMAIRANNEETEPAIQKLFELLAEHSQMDGAYLILLIKDSYDVPEYNANGDKNEDSSEVFNYFLCALCPVKDTKAALSFKPTENSFKSITANSVVGAPEVGFTFPAFNDRSSDIYNVLYYTKNTALTRSELIENVFHTEVPMPADTQKETFNSILKETLEENCSLDVAVAVRDAMCDSIQSYKSGEEEEAPVITKHSVRKILDECSVPKERADKFEEKYDEAFGEKAELSPNNLVDTKAISVNTPDVSIKISPDRSDLIQTRMIDGVRYILIRAENGVEVNGVDVNI